MIILGTNSIKDTGFDVANSVRYNDGDSPKLNINFGSDGTLNKWTFSMWFKRSTLGTAQRLFCVLDTGMDDYIKFDTADQLEWTFDHEDGSNRGILKTNRKFRDVSAWYHLVCRLDTTDGTAGDRMRMYINGVEETSFATDTNPPQNETGDIGRDNNHFIGTSGSSQYFDGYFAEVCMINNQSLVPTSFGEFDEDSAIWKPIDVSGLTAGTNGFYLDFEDSSNLGNDAFGGTDWTETNLTAVDQSTDTCTNNFATWNSLIKTTATFSEGNLKYAQPGSNPVFGSLSTIGVTSGKWYAELNYTSGSSHYLILGVADETFQNGNTTATYDLGKSGTTSSIAYIVNTGAYRVNNSNTSWGSGGGDGDIINMAIDRDNNKIYFGVNGTWGNSSNPASNSGGIPTTALDSSTNWFWGITSDTSGTSDVGELNFGSPSYSESGGETDGNGYGNFAHAPPSGYFALNTKNLAEYG